jgi:hypothetical protein
MRPIRSSVDSSVEILEIALKVHFGCLAHPVVFSGAKTLAKQPDLEGLCVQDLRRPMLAGGGRETVDKLAPKDPLRCFREGGEQPKSLKKHRFCTRDLRLHPAQNGDGGQLLLRSFAS